MNTQNDTKADYDSAWKEILGEYFKEFLLFYFPAIYEDIDFTKPIEFLDKELNKIVKESEDKKRRADRLVKVYLKDGLEQWLLIHVEVQGDYDKNFSERIYVYNYRIFDRYKKEVITLVIMTDESKTYKPDKFEIKRWGFHLLCKYPLIKLIDYQGKVDFDKAQNPFEIVTFVHLKNLETQEDNNERYFWKITLVKKLYQKGFSKQEIVNLYRFIDWVMTLKDDLAITFKNEIYKFEEESKMPYITSIGRLERKEGRKEGSEETAQEMVIEVIKEKFGIHDSTIHEQIKNISSQQTLKELIHKAIRIDNFPAFQEELNKLTSHA
jgi:hypothetical protein